jgi:hypothetical protein
MFRLRRRLTTWAALTIAVPLAARALRRASGTIESRHGPTANSARLRRLAGLAEQLPKRRARRR